VITQFVDPVQTKYGPRNVEFTGAPSVICLALKVLAVRAPVSRVPVEIVFILTVEAFTVRVGPVRIVPELRFIVEAVRAAVVIDDALIEAAVSTAFGTYRLFKVDPAKLPVIFRFSTEMLLTANVFALMVPP